MLYICIPTYNEAPTIGVLLWRVRKVFQEFSREYEVLVYDDGSTDATGEALVPYGEVLPLSVIRGESRRGYGHALGALASEASRRTRHARRDAMIVMQADFTDTPESLPELVKRFEGGADIVAAEWERSAAQPAPVRRLRMLAPWVVRPFVSAGEVKDPFASFRLYRISLIRELLKTTGNAPLVSTDGWAANMEMIMRLTPFARRIETVPITPRHDLRPRESRVRPLPDALALYRFSRQLRGLRPTVST